jgi:N-acetylneuraminic acid mutarotase
VAVRRGPRIIILGGLAAGDVTTSRVVSLDLATRRASTVGSLREAVHDASGALLNGRAVVFGGGAAQEVSDVQAWTSGTSGVVGRLSSGRSDSASAVLDGAAYVVGGFDGTGMTRGILATNDGRHFRVAGHLKVGVRYPAVAAAAGAIWVVGGQLATTASTAAGGQSDAIQRFDPGTGRTTVVGHLPKTLGHAMAFVLGGQLFLAGGRHGTTATARIWRMDERTGQVTAAGRLPFAFSDAAAVIVDDQAWLIGGETSGPTAPLRTVVAVGYRGLSP